MTSIPDAPSPNHRAIAIWLLVCCAMIFAMIVIGGITRLTDSGLSMVEWRPLMGWLPPLTEAAWQDVFAKYQATPQFQKTNAGMDLAGFRTIFWWEFIHRVWGRLIGVVFALPFLWFLIRGRIDRRLAPRLVIMLILGGLQGVLGWYMVKSRHDHQIGLSRCRAKRPGAEPVDIEPRRAVRHHLDRAARQPERHRPDAALPGPVQRPFDARDDQAFLKTVFDPAH